MLKPVIFFSWQSDFDKSASTDFIKTALDRASASVATVELPLRPDSDTAGVAGTPDVASTIFEKISGASICAFDVTPIAKTGKGRALSNPNVLLELGFAASAVGWSRLLLIFDLARGFKPKELPFDLRGRRWPITYNSQTDSPESLAQALVSPIEMALMESHAAVENVRAQLSSECMALLLGITEGVEYFSLPADPVILRLLDLRIIRAHYNLKESAYAYHWTPLGRELRRQCFVEIAIPSKTTVHARNPMDA